MQSWKIENHRRHRFSQERRCLFYDIGNTFEIDIEISLWKYSFAKALTESHKCNIVYLLNKYTILHSGGKKVEIIISSNTNKPIYEQITDQIKAMVLNGELHNGDPIPSMRALAKSLHISVITVQRAYEDLQRDGFVETTVGRGSFISANSKEFYQEEQQKAVEEHLIQAVNIARRCGISEEKLMELVRIFYQEEE